MKVSAIKCPCCGDTIYSRACHDYRSCSCFGVSIDGGFDYIKVSCDPKLSNIKLCSVNVDATKDELYTDWNQKKDKFGLIRNENGVKRAVKTIRSEKKK